MKYQIGEIGRVTVVKFDDGDAVLDNIVEIARKEEIKAGIFYLLGGMKDAAIVVGPEKDELPPTPVWREISEAHETLGIGTIFWQDGEPRIHFHGGFGKGENVRVGCLRERAETFIVLEGVILEIKGVHAVRQVDPASGMALLALV